MAALHEDRRKSHLLVVAMIPCVLLSGCSEQFVEKGPTLQDALDAPAADLALGYLTVKHTLRFVEIGERATVTIGNATINKNNVEEYKAKYGERLSLYRTAIEQRGFKTVAGTYNGKATESCARSNALWAALIQQQAHKVIEITQEEMDAEVIIFIDHEGKERSLKNQAAVADSGMALNEMTNSDYYFKGEVRDNIIVFKPDLSVLRTWPKWAGPPDRKDLEDCAVTLERRAESAQE